MVIITGCKVHKVNGNFQESWYYMVGLPDRVNFSGYLPGYLEQGQINCIIVIDRTVHAISSVRAVRTLQESVIGRIAGRNYGQWTTAETCFCRAGDIFCMQV